MMDCTSQGLPDPADEIVPQVQLPQTLVPGLINVLEQLPGADKLLVDLVQFFIMKVLKVVSLQDKALLWAGPGPLEPESEQKR